MAFNIIFKDRKKIKLSLKRCLSCVVLSSQTNPRPKKVTVRGSNLLGLTKNLACHDLPLSKTCKPGVWCFWMRMRWGRVSSRSIRPGSIPAPSFSPFPFSSPGRSGVRVQFCPFCRETLSWHSLLFSIHSFIQRLHEKQDIMVYNLIPSVMVWVMQWTTQPLLNSLSWWPYTRKRRRVLFFYKQGNWEFHKFT